MDITRTLFATCAGLRLGALQRCCSSSSQLWGAGAVEQVRLMHNVLGGVIDPHAAFLVNRGVKTLDLRVERANRSAFELARRLEAHKCIARVHYPGAPPSAPPAPAQPSARRLPRNYRCMDES